MCTCVDKKTKKKQNKTNKLLNVYFNDMQINRSRYIYQVVCGEFPFAATCLEKE